jgi:Holliday junction resolvasome RuvABC endonuclease subunit
MVKNRAICGIDYSTSSPSICINVGLDIDFHYLTTVKRNARQEQHGKFQFAGTHLLKFSLKIQQYDFIAKWAMGVLDLYRLDHIFIEDYAFAATGKVFHIGENTGLLKYRLYKRDYAFQMIAPTMVKKFATTKGNAKKDEMLAQFNMENNIDLRKVLNIKTENPVSDIVDSYYIWQYGFIHTTPDIPMEVVNVIPG